MSLLVVLDNEAVQALGDPRHPKHRRAVGHLQVVAQRKRRAVEVAVVVPTTVRVEAGWDRTAASWSFPNRLRIRDDILDGDRANLAATIHREAQVSVADAHIGAVVRSTAADNITVLTSDRADVALVAGDRPVTVVAL